jgi:hypothetical protein
MVSRAELAISGVFVFLASTIGGALGFGNWFAEATGWDGFLLEAGATGTLWIVGVGIAFILLLMVKRSSHQ